MTPFIFSMNGEVHMLRSKINLVTAILVALALTGAGFAQTDSTLTNDQVVEMVAAGLSPGIIATTITSAGSVQFDLSPEGLIALQNAEVPARVTQAMLFAGRRGRRVEIAGAATRNGPEKSELLARANDPAIILQSFRTLAVNARSAQFFRNEQMKAALGADKGFDALGITIVDDLAVADVVLNVGYTFAWDYPFSLKHQNTSMVLVSGKGEGPFSGPVGAASVASELVKLLKDHRVEPLEE